MTAFAKQRSTGSFRMDSETNGESGRVLIVEEYVLPNRLRQKIVVPNQPEPLETILVGSQAWTKREGNWHMLLPAFAQTLVAQVRVALVDPPKDIGDFECLDKVTSDGTEYLAYRSVSKPGATASAQPTGGQMHRTIYVDPNTGLPAMNIIAEERSVAVPLFKGVYSYPKDIAIEAISDAVPEGPR